MKNIKGRAIRVIKRLSIEPETVAPVIVKSGNNNAAASRVANWILERQETRVAEIVFSSSKILSWKST
jgi:hypothetical protein